jgi:hypothetical protein
VVLLGVLAPALAQQPFSDVPLDHWAYNAVNKLAEQGLIEGYPNGTFKGKQPLTRYEFAQALARLMDRVEQMAKQPGPVGPQGPQGPAGVGGGGLTEEQKALLDRLTKEFAPELKALRSDLDNVIKRVAELEAKPSAKGPVITVSGDIGVRGGLYGTALGTGDVATTGYPFFGDLRTSGGSGMASTPMTAGGGLFIGSVAPYGGINLPDFDPVTGLWGDQIGFPGGPSFIGSIPISDALKDAFKASDFLAQRTRINLTGSLNENTDVKVQLWSDPLNNNPRDTAIDADVNSPNQFAGNGIMDMVNVREAWFNYRTNFLLPFEMTVGKQFVKKGEGLLIDNDIDGVKGVKLDWNKDKQVSFGAYFGMLDREQFFGRSAGALGLPKLTPALFASSAIYGGGGMYTAIGEPKTEGQDNLNLYYAGIKLGKSWDIGLNWLASGFNKEEGWSADLTGKGFGLGWYGEFAQLRKWPTGMKFFDADGDTIRDNNEVSLEQAGRNAWLGGVKWDSSWVSLTGEYGRLDPGYAFSPGGSGFSQIGPFSGGSDFFTFNLPLSALHPLAEVSPYDINWVDRPMFLDPTNIAKGWHVVAGFPKLLGKDTGLCVSYAGGKAFNPEFLSWIALNSMTAPGFGIPKPGKWVDADTVWTVKLSHQLSTNVTARLLYGRRNADKVLSKQQVPVITTSTGGVIVNHFAINDAIQVLRAELSVGF